MPEDPGALQFDRAEPSGAAPGGTPPEAPAPTGCTHCKRSLSEVYHAINGRPICAPCRDGLQQALTGGSPGRRVLRACAGGFAGGAAGAAVWYGVSALTGYQLGLVAILVGVLVGRGVRWGADYRGGWAYQLLAVAISYLAIAASYGAEILPMVRKDMPSGHSVNLASAGSRPDEVAEVVARARGCTAEQAKEVVARAAGVRNGLSAEDARKLAAELEAAGATARVREHSGTESLLYCLFVTGAISLAAPFFTGLMGILIVLIALHQAWVVNKRLVLAFTGPFRLSRPQPDPAQP